MRGALAIGLLSASAVIALAASCGSFGTNEPDPPLPERDASLDGTFVGIEAGSGPTCADTCASLKATCGEIEIGCDKRISCGACDAGSCQANDGGPFACGA